ncbi:hypothetical protein L1S32_11000 [Methanogenium sp. S4BF]|uniref:hypothetical protein n=1 Tax=Methanogenium sp. S4BF TaxID=1789226 RepID=UPI0024165F26|nr:hypothetical protein [Methanogenium sp. S4BF]WFN34355.1 hypothetical protein L1S32_11000 [Methanogenium sp. S4BF]
MKQVHRQYLLMIAVLVVSVAACGCTSSLFSSGPTADYPEVGPYEEDGRLVTSSLVFPFQKSHVPVSVTVPQGLYEVASGADKRAVLLGDWEEDDDWTTGYYLSFLTDPQMELVYSATADALKTGASGTSYSSDEYLEYLTVYVQSLAYDTSPDEAGPKFPVETVVETAGDCDDKSILLAGLLSREGYNVSLFYFPDDSHMAVGVASDESGFRGSGYLFIETTNVSLVGIPTEKFENGEALTSDLFVIPVGNGTKEYGKADETRWIERAAAEARLRAETEGASLAAQEDELDQMKRDLDEENAALSRLKRSGDIRGYNAAVDAYNRRVAEYNQLLEEYRISYAVYLKDVEFANFVATHLYDRPGLSDAVTVWERGLG